MCELETNYSQEHTNVSPEQPGDLENSIDSQSSVDSPVTNLEREELKSNINKTNSDTEQEDLSEVCQLCLLKFYHKKDVTITDCLE